MTQAFLYAYSSMLSISSKLHVEYKTRIPYSSVLKNMVEHTDNQKKRGNVENKTAFYYIRYRQAKVSRISTLTSSLEIVVASESLVGRFFQIFLGQTTTTTDGQNRLLNPACAYAHGVKRQFRCSLHIILFSYVNTVHVS